MGFRTLFNSLRNRRVRRVRRNLSRRLSVGALEDRAVPATFSISDVTIIEGNSGITNAQLTVSLNGTGNPSMSVGYVTANGSAAAGSDYQSKSGRLNFPKGVTTKTILIPINGDINVESDETFYVNLQNPKKATIADGRGVVTVVNDDAQISIGDVYLSEGNSGTTSFNFPVNLSHAVNEPVTVTYGTADGSAVEDSDYAAGSGTVTIPTGQTSGTITVLVTADNQIESEEEFYVNLSNPSVGTIIDSQGTGYIYDDEPYIYISSASAAEGNDGTTAFDFTVTLSSATGVAVTVDFATSDGLAVAGDGDYVETFGTVTFDPGVTSQTITVQVNGDLNVEADEDFYVNLSNPTNAQIGYNLGAGSIVSDDNAVLHIDSYWDYEPDPYYGGLNTFYFTVWLSSPATETVTVDFSTFDGDAIDGWDYWGTSGTLIFENGQLSQTIAVSVLSDSEYEWTEYFYVALSNVSANAVIQPGWDVGYGTIYDNSGYWW